MEKKLRSLLLEKFCRYVAVPSQSDESASEVPSTGGQWNLAHLLAAELKELGLQDVYINDYCVVHAYLPARLSDPNQEVAKIGWVCHLDTVDVGLSPEIYPRLIKDYQGEAIIQNQSEHIILSPDDHPELLNYLGDDLIVSDGTSVLGADNKAAIANVMTVLDILKRHSEIEHGDLYIAFVPDEEIGLRGVRKIDFERFPVDYAYTIDCCEIGELVYETFNAGSGQLRVKGVSAHPMSAKGQLVNPLLVATDFIQLMDRGQTPELTERREGYIWVTDMEANAMYATLDLNIRDHDRELYEAKKDYLKQCAELIQMKHPKAEVTLELSDTYANIADAVTEENRDCITNLYEAYEELGIEAKTMAMRGGTDGSYLSSQGILTPNYFTGAHNFHSSAEFLPVSSFIQSTQVTLKLIEISLRKRYN